MKLVSIIVPIYNMETFVSRGVQCLKAQTYPNLEILLIDDGSTDGSGIACDQEAQMDRRIRVYHTANRGAGPARNLGIQQATGTYLHFFDVDDFLYPNAITLLVEAAEKPGLTWWWADFLWTITTGINVGSPKQTTSIGPANKFAAIFIRICGCLGNGESSSRYVLNFFVPRLSENTLYPFPISAATRTRFFW